MASDEEVRINSDKATILSWKVRKGDAVTEGQILAELDCSTNSKKEITSLNAPVSGYVKSITAREGEKVTKDNVVAHLFVCYHDVVFAGLCAVCGKNVSSLGGFIAHGHPQLGVSKREAQRIDSDIAKKLLKQKKLSLVLDLDHTLIHATVEHDLKGAPVHGDDIYKFTLPPNPSLYYIKLRPGLMNFLNKLHEIYELHIYTMGTRQYATKIAEIIDKSSQMFTENKIMSRDDAGDMNSKNLTRLFPWDNTMVVVVDDREDVWVSNGQPSPNLVKIEPFHYFDTHREVNELPIDRAKVNVPKEEVPTPDEKEAKPDSDTHLTHMLRILTKIHQKFYASDSENDVKSIIRGMKKDVFHDCVFAFSGLIPINTKAKESEVWKLAESFGATCCDKFEKQVTHVLAVKPGTHKVNEALNSSETFLVNANWLYESVKAWKRFDEFEFPLDNLPVLNQSNPHKRRKLAKSVNTEVQASEGEESADEMASMLEQEMMSVLEEDN